MLPSQHLRFGPYKTPSFKYGDVVYCAVAGGVKLVGLSDGKIPWPLGKRKVHATFAVFGDLAEAVRKESNAAVCYWWGVTPQTVTIWRKALDVPRANVGTRTALSLLVTDEKREAMQSGLAPTYSDPKRNAKISKARTGKPRPKHVHEILRRANVGRKWSDRQRQLKLEARMRRYPKDYKPLTKKDDKLIRTLTVKDAMAATGLSKAFIQRRRRELRQEV